MCSLPAAVIGLQAAQGAYNFVSGNKFARDMQRYQENRSEIIAESARADAVQKYSSLAKRSRQEQRSAQQRIAAITREAALARGRVSSGAAASGVEGASVDAVLNDFAVQESARVVAARQDAAASQDQLADVRRSVEAEAQQRIFSSIGSPIQTPSLFGSLLEIGTSALGTYLNNSSIDPSTGNRQFNS